MRLRQKDGKFEAVLRHTRPCPKTKQTQAVGLPKSCDFFIYYWGTQNYCLSMVLVTSFSFSSYMPWVNHSIFVPQFLIWKVGAIPTLPSLESVLRSRVCPILSFYAHSRRGIQALLSELQKNKEQAVSGGASWKSEAGLYLLPTNLALSNHLCFSFLLVGTLVVPGHLGCFSGLVDQASILILSYIMLPLRPLTLHARTKWLDQ